MSNTRYSAQCSPTTRLGVRESTIRLTCDNQVCIKMVVSWHASLTRAVDPSMTRGDDVECFPGNRIPEDRVDLAYTKYDRYLRYCKTYPTPIPRMLSQ